MTVWQYVCFSPCLGRHPASLRTQSSAARPSVDGPASSTNYKWERRKRSKVSMSNKQFRCLSEWRRMDRRHRRRFYTPIHIFEQTKCNRVKVRTCPSWDGTPRRCQPPDPPPQYTPSSFLHMWKEKWTFNRKGGMWRTKWLKKNSYFASKKRRKKKVHTKQNTPSIFYQPQWPPHRRGCFSQALWPLLSHADRYGQTDIPPVTPPHWHWPSASLLPSGQVASCTERTTEKTLCAGQQRPAWLILQQKKKDKVRVKEGKRKEIHCDIVPLSATPLLFKPTK